MPEINLRSAIIPLYLVGKLFCLNAFTYSPGIVYPSDNTDDTHSEDLHDDDDGDRRTLRSSSWTIGSANHSKQYGNICANNHYRSGIIMASGNNDGDSISLTAATTHNNKNGQTGITALRNQVKLASQSSLKISITVIVHVVAFGTLYTAFHIYSTLELYSKLTRPELVRMVIDLINQYAGCCVVVALVTTALVNQHSLMKLINALFEIDDLLMSRLNIAARGAGWLVHLTTLFIASIIIKCSIEAISRSETNPENLPENFLLLQLIPQLVCLVSELQYIACVLLIKDRYVALKQALAKTETLRNATGIANAKGSFQIVNQLQETCYPEGFIVQQCTSFAKADNVASALTKNITNQGMTMMNRLESRPHRLKFQAETNQLRHIYEIYLKLRHTICLTNRSFGVRNLIMVLYHFVMVVEMSYVACMIWLVGAMATYLIILIQFGHLDSLG